jgi:hypothetical protein
VDPDYLPKDPARKVEVPKQLLDTDTTVLSWGQLRTVLTKELKDWLLLELDMKDMQSVLRHSYRRFIYCGMAA